MTILQKQYACGKEDCDAKFSTKAHALRHMKNTDHGDVKSPNPRKGHYQCSVCQKEFNKNFDLRIHMATHTGDKPLKCKICGTGFALKNRLNSHMKTHKIYECTVDRCEFQADKWSLLRKHMISHKVKCDHCSASFATETSLKNHMLKHEMSLSCPFCESTYSRKSNLKTHIRTAHEKITYRCSIKSCGKELSHKKSLRQHMKLHAAGAFDVKQVVETTSAGNKEIKRKTLAAEKLTGHPVPPDEKDKLLLADVQFRKASAAGLLEHQLYTHLILNESEKHVEDEIMDEKTGGDVPYNLPEVTLSGVK